MKRPDIQGLRAIAVLAVIVFHTNKDWLPGGFVGVDVFFVISGYLISSIIIDQKQRGIFSFPRFYFSRIKRIVPAYCFVLAVSGVVFSVLFIPSDFGRFLNSLKSALQFLSNSFFSKQADYFAPASFETPLVHTWSLAVEMQFYLFLPLLLFYLPTRVLRPVILLLIVGGVSYSTYKLGLGQRQKEYYSLISRTPEFLVGSFLAVFPVWKGMGRLLRESSAIVGFCIIVASCLLINDKSLFPGWLVLFPTLGAFLVLVAERSAVSSMLSSPLLVRIGDLSYSMYLWHWPILAGLRYYSETYQLTGSNVALFIFLTGGLSVFSLRYVEAPFRHGNIDLRSSSRLAFLAIAVGCAVFAAIWINREIVPPLPVELTRYAAPEEICHGKVVGECLRGDLSSKRTILMLGDSHAAQLNHFADEIGRSTGVSVRVISSPSCITIPGFDWERIPSWAQAECKRQIQHAAQYLRGADAVIIAGMWQHHARSERFLAALESYVRSVEHHQKVIVLAQVPMLTSNVQRFHRFDNLGISRGGGSIHLEWQPANDYVKRAVTGVPNARFVDFSNANMFSSPPYYEGGLIYLDDNHLNEVGAGLLGRHAGQAFIELLDSE